MNKDKSPETALVRSSAAEYLTFIAATGAQQTSVEMRYEDENIWLTHTLSSLCAREIISCPEMPSPDYS